MAVELSDYKFKSYYWPPPDDRKHPDVYLIGFDSDNQPYIVRWEKAKSSQGWIATTLSESKASGSSAVPRNFYDDQVDKLIQYWADAPALERAVFKAKAHRKDE